MFRNRIAACLVVLLTLGIVAQAQPSPTPTPDRPVSQDELKRSTQRFSDELDKTKNEVANALNESKKEETPKPVAKPKAAATNRHRTRARPKDQRKVEVTPQPDIIASTPNVAGTSVNEKPTIPLVKVEPEKQDQAAVTLKLKKPRTFWQNLWRVLPFRFFGEH